MINGTSRKKEHVVSASTEGLVLLFGTACVLT